MAFGEAMKMMGGKSKPQVGMKGSEKPVEKGEVKGEEGEEGGGDALSLHSNGDGTYHTEGGGGQEEHPTLGHALMHMAHHNEPEGKHMHIHHDGLSVKSHGIHESGEHDGPHEHDDLEGAKDHMDQMMGDGGDEDGDEDEEEMPLGHGLHG